MAKQRGGLSLSVPVVHTQTRDSTIYRIATLTANGCSTAKPGDTPLGVFQTYALASGSVALVQVLGHSKVVSGSDSLAVGDMVKADSTGRAIAANADAFTGTVGVVMRAASSGSIAEVLLYGPSAKAS